MWGRRKEWKVNFRKQKKIKNNFGNEGATQVKFKFEEQLVKTNYIHNYIQRPFFGPQKRRKPLIYKGFRLVRETGLEPASA